MITKDSLGIYRNFNGDLLEVDGLYFYSLFENKVNKINLNDINKLWRTGEVDFKITEFDYVNHYVYCIDLYILKFPDLVCWINNIKDIFIWLANKGALISWCGAEDSSPNINIFDSKSFYGNIYACFTRDTGFMCNADLYDTIDYLNDEQLDVVYKLNEHLFPPDDPSVSK